VHDVLPEQGDVAAAERLRARRLDARGAAVLRGQRAPEYVVLAALVDADQPPGAVLVRLEGDPRRPGEVQHGQVRPHMQAARRGAARLAEGAHQGRRVGDGPGHQLAQCAAPDGIRGQRGAALGDEAVGIEHGVLRAPRGSESGPAPDRLGTAT
jgi:hypothetical protein